MDAEYFTNDADVRRILRELQDRLGDKQFSDIVDGEGRQYVDLVLEGGGVLGVALVGYIYALERMHIRFLRIGGTSAGSIVALLLAALGPPAAAKAGEIVAHLGEADLFRFIDADDDSRDFIESLIEKAHRYIQIFKGLQVRDTLNEELGLVMGRAFAAWLEEILQRAGIHSTQELQERLLTAPEGLALRDGTPMGLEEADPKLAIIAADVTTQTKVEFPKMAELYWPVPERVPPAKFVRASMSIPFFFQPLRITNIPSGPEAIAAWWKHARYDENLPRDCTLVDGGMMSNFPIGIFHDHPKPGEPLKPPTAPTFGAKLRTASRRQKVEDPEQLLFGVINAARHTLDYDFFLKNPDFSQLVVRIDTKGHDWLNFRMEDAEKLELFVAGVEAAKDFLYSFDWGRYKDHRLGKVTTDSG